MELSVGFLTGTPLIFGWDRAGFIITPGTYPSLNGVDVSGATADFTEWLGRRRSS